jgi:hypothetical protein
MRFPLILLMVLGSAGLIRAQSVSTDWDRCHRELKNTEESTSDASRAAADASSKLEDYESCRSDPATYDLMHDGCRTRRLDFESAIGDVQGKMENLDSLLRTVQSSCDYQFTINRMSAVDAAKIHADAAEQRLCVSNIKSPPVGIKFTNNRLVCMFRSPGIQSRAELIEVIFRTVDPGADSR